MKSRCAHAAFSLVEVTLALGVATFCLLTLVALLPTGLKTEQSASEETASMNIGAGILADLRAYDVNSSNAYVTTPAATPGSPRYQLVMPASTPQQTVLYLDADGSPLTTSDAVARSGRYTAVLTLVPQPTPTPSPSSATTTTLLGSVKAHLLITWPAQYNASVPASTPLPYNPGDATTDRRAQIGRPQGSVEIVSSLTANP